jgi:hypothetical protein
MTIKEFAAKQVVKQVLPLAGRMSDRDLRRLLSTTRRVAPNEFTRTMANTLEYMHEQQPAMIELLRRTLRQTNPRIRNKLIETLLINEFMRGNEVRQQLRSQDLATPSVYLLSPTMRCNLRCPGCYAANYSKKDDLELEVIDRVITEGKELGMYWVTVLGGEPLIREDMWQIYQQHDDVFFQVFTNGCLVDKEAARKLAATGNVLVIFSIEGFEAETDARRGKGVFQKVMQGMDNLREMGGLSVFHL